MAILTVTSTQLDAIGYYKLMPRYIMFPQSGYHIRVDQKQFPNGNLSMQVGTSNVWSYQISSFHVKRDLFHSSFKSTTPGPMQGLKIVDDQTNYVYFKYVDGGVWQPLWGYYKQEQMNKGQTFWKQTGEMDTNAWSFACDVARWFLGRLSKAMGEGKEQGLAMGPVQGAAANLFTQL